MPRIADRFARTLAGGHDLLANRLAGVRDLLADLLARLRDLVADLLACLRSAERLPGRRDLVAGVAAGLCDFVARLLARLRDLVAELLGRLGRLRAELFARGADLVARLPDRLAGPLSRLGGDLVRAPDGVLRRLGGLLSELLMLVEALLDCVRDLLGRLVAVVDRVARCRPRGLVALLARSGQHLLEQLLVLALAALDLGALLGLGLGLLLREVTLPLPEALVFLFERREALRRALGERLEDERLASLRAALLFFPVGLGALARSAAAVALGGRDALVVVGFAARDLVRGRRFGLAFHVREVLRERLAALLDLRGRSPALVAEAAGTKLG